MVLEGEADNNDSDDNFTCDSGASSSSDDLSTEGEVEEITTNDSDNWSTGSFDLDKKKRRRLQKKKAKEMKKMTDAVQKPDAISKAKFVLTTHCSQIALYIFLYSSF